MIIVYMSLLLLIILGTCYVGSWLYKDYRHTRRHVNHTSFKRARPQYVRPANDNGAWERLYGDPQIVDDWPEDYDES